MTGRLQFWSCGGGTQSAAIAALIVQGKLPRPDLIAIADTERERESVWKYNDEIVSPALAKIGLKIERVKRSDYAKEDLWQEWGGINQMLMPVFIAQADGSTGRLKAYCSSRWKRRVILRWLKEQGVKECDAWYGMTLDEMRRVRVSSEAWYQHRYPLIFDLPMRRSEAIQVVEELGWPTPPRSACWMCPNREDEEWFDMKKNYPADFASAVALEKEMQLQRPDFFLHRALQPLDSIDFQKTQFTMFKGDGDYSCTEGCFT